jgi:nucleoside-diphosphate-sugar epimerase
MQSNLSKFLVSGASGFIGEAFTEYLNRRGVFSDKIGRVDLSFQQLVSMSKFNFQLFDDDTNRLFQDKTNFVHLATKYEKPGLESDPFGIIEANLNYSLLCLRLASYHNLHFTTVSSIQQFDGTSGIYAKSKNLFDSIVDFERKDGLKTARLILGDTFGENDKRLKVINYIVTQTLNGKALELSHPRNCYAPVYINEVSKRLFQCSQDQGVYKLIPQESIDLFSLVAMCEEIFGRKIEVNWKNNEGSPPVDWDNVPGEEVISEKNLLRLPTYIASEWEKRVSAM